MENIRRYFKRTDKTYLLLCIFSSVMAVTALSSWAAKQGNGFAVDEITGQITGLGDYRRAAVQAGAALIGLVSAVLLCAAVVSMLRISRKDAHLGARCLVYALGGAAVVCLVLGVGVKPMIGLTRLGIDPPALKNLLIAYVGGLFGRFVVMAVIYFVLAIVLGVLVSRHKKHRA